MKRITVLLGIHERREMKRMAKSVGVPLGTLLKRMIKEQQERKNLPVAFEELREAIYTRDELKD